MSKTSYKQEIERSKENFNSRSNERAQKLAALKQKIQENEKRLAILNTQMDEVENRIMAFQQQLNRYPTYNGVFLKTMMEWMYYAEEKAEQSNGSCTVNILTIWKSTYLNKNLFQTL